MKKKVEKENLITALYCRMSVDDIQRKDGMDSSRNVVLEEMMLEMIRKTAKYITENETVFLYLYEKNHKLSAAKEMRDTKLRVEQSKKRIKELDGLIST